MLNYEEHVLACLGEECGETSQIVGKSVRFGAHDAKHGVGATNAERMKLEFHDIVAVYRMYCEEIGERFGIDEPLLESKEKRVHLHMLLAYINGKMDIGTHFRKIYSNLPEHALDPYIQKIISELPDIPTKSQIAELLRLCERIDTSKVKRRPHEWVFKSLLKYQDALRE